MESRWVTDYDGATVMATRTNNDPDYPWEVERATLYGPPVIAKFTDDEMVGWHHA